MRTGAERSDKKPRVKPVAAASGRTTLNLPPELLEATDRLIASGQVRSRNEFIAAAVRRELAVRRRAEIDAAFAVMGQDADYMAESKSIAAEFEHAGWQSIQISETSP